MGAAVATSFAFFALCIDSPGGWKGTICRKLQLRGTPNVTRNQPAQLCRSVDALLNRGKTPLPADIDAAQFHRFFDDKVAGVRSTISALPLVFFANRELHHTSLTNSTSHLLMRLVSVSAVRRHHRSLSDAPSAIELPIAAARLWNTAAERDVTSASYMCFQETFEDPFLQSFYPHIKCACSDFVISNTKVDLLSPANSEFCSNFAKFR